MDEPTTVADYERSLRQAGLPLFVEGWSASEDVYTRALPLLALVFIVELAGAINVQWGPVANLFAILGGVVVVLVGFAIGNRIAHPDERRGFFSVPQRIGRPERVAFVIVPALLPLIFGGQWRSALVTALFNLLLLWLIWVIVGYGVVSILRWTGSRLFAQLASSFGLLVRALPLMMIFSLVLFFTTEMWQVFTVLPARLQFVLFSVLVLLGSAFMAARIPREVDQLEKEAGGDGPPLSKKQRANLGLVMFIAQALQVLIVTLAIFAFFVLLGVLAVPEATQAVWLGHPPTPVWLSFNLLGTEVVLTQQLVLVSGAIAAFSGLYFAIAVLTDGTYREEFLTQITDQMRATFQLRRSYLHALKERAPVVE